jgi:hypothetical protein
MGGQFLFRRNKMIFSTKLSVLMFGLVLACFSNAYSQDNSVGVTPASIDAKVTRGTNYTQTFTIFNNTGTRLRFECSAEDMWYDVDNKRVSGRAGTLPRSASLWVLFSPAEVIVEAHSSSKVVANVSVPASAAGGYYTVPVFKSMPADARPEGVLQAESNSATASIGVRFLLLMMFTTVSASEYNVEVMGGRITPPTASAELSMELDVFNRSTTHVNLRGAFALLDASGRLVGRGTIPTRRYLPNQRNVIGSGWSGELPPGMYTSVITLSYDRVGLSPATIVYELPLVVQ